MPHAGTHGALAQTMLSCLLHIVNDINLCHEKNHPPNSSTPFVYFPPWSLLSYESPSSPVQNSFRLYVFLSFFIWQYWGLNSGPY
jgi:hypothetical protein